MILLKAPIISPILPEYSESYAHAYAARVPYYYVQCTKYNGQRTKDNGPLLYYALFCVIICVFQKKALPLRRV